MSQQKLKTKVHSQDHFFHRRPPDNGNTQQRKNSFTGKYRPQSIVSQPEFPVNRPQFEFDLNYVISRLDFTISGSLICLFFPSFLPQTASVIRTEFLPFCQHPFCVGLFGFKVDWHVQTRGMLVRKV